MSIRETIPKFYFSKLTTHTNNINEWMLLNLFFYPGPFPTLFPLARLHLFAPLIVLEPHKKLYDSMLKNTDLERIMRIII